MSTTEIIQALVSPTQKLIEEVSGAIGKVYEPWHIKRMADAKAYELTKISDAVRNNSDVPITYDSTGVSIDTSNFEEIVKRAGSRLAYQEIKKEQNIEAVVDNAYQELQGADSVSSDPVDPDWMFRFFNSVENISNEDMQKIWGRILAGEVKSPSRYSYRTLEKLRNITKEEAQLFQEVASLSLTHENRKFLLKNDSLMNKYDIYFSDIFKLEECGLMSSHSLSLNLSISNEKPEIVWNSHILGKIVGITPEVEQISLPIYIFTEAGSQLLDAIQPQQNKTYILDCLEHIRRNYKKANVTAHTINFVDDKQIKYKEVDILLEAKEE